MQATQGNQKPHDDSTQGFGAEIFYKPRRNVVQGEYILEARNCMMGTVWVLELHSGDKAYIVVKLQGSAL